MEEQKQQEPWEMEWIKKPIQAAVDIVEGAVKAFKEPWEMPWKAKATTPLTPSRKAPVERSKGFDMEGYLKTTASVESGNNPAAKARTSSATGLYQFTAGTWNDMVNSMNLDYTLADRKDPVKSQEVMKAFTQRNVEKAKEDLGREPTHLEAYMYHFLGKSAPKVLKAGEDEVAANLVTKAQAKSNKSVFYDKDGKAKTVKEVLAKYRERFE